MSIPEKNYAQAVASFNKIFTQTDEDLPAFVNLDVAAKVDRTANEQNDQIDSRC